MIVVPPVFQGRHYVEAVKRCGFIFWESFMALAVKYNREHPFSRECLMNFLIAFRRMRNDCQPSGRCVERR